MSYSLSSQPCINLLYITGCDPAAKLDKAVKELARRMDEIEYANTETNEICEGNCGKYEGGRKGGANEHNDGLVKRTEREGQPEKSSCDSRLG